MAAPDATAVPAPPSGLTVAAALRVAADRLRASGSPSPRLDAEVLAAEVLECDRAWLLAHPEAAVPVGAVGAFERLVDRRATGEPIAYIRGFKEWLSLRIRTDARALIPRPETELLAEAAVEEVAGRLRGAASDDARVVAWDVGTGSGCLAVALALRFRAEIAGRRLRLIASDVSGDALELAASNLAAHDLEEVVELVEGSLLSSAGGTLPRPSVVVANLPYIPSDDVPLLPVAASFEPRAALDGGADGLDVVRALLDQLPERLAPGGCALLEIGAGQLPGVRDAAASRGLAVDLTLTDLGGVDRVIRVVRDADVPRD